MRPAALAALAAVVACSGRATSTDRKTLIDSRDISDPRSLDPALSTDVPTGRAVGYVFEGLTQFSPEARVEPGLAERWEISADGLTYTFHLRRGVRFQDGTPFVARQVIHSWQRALDPATKGGRAEPLQPILGARDFADGKARTVAGLSAPNDSTLVVRLAEPLATFIKLLAMPVAAVVPDRIPADFGSHPIGTGPWRLVEWKHDDYLLFARNNSYWAGPPKQDSLRARIIAEPSTAVAEFESGNVDLLIIPSAETREWKEDESRRPLLTSTAALQLVYIGINTTRGVLRDPRVRQAINYAIDRRTILDRLFSGNGTLANGVIPPTLGGHDSTRAPYPFDQAKARQLLAAAGATNARVELWVSPRYLRMAETVQAYLQAVGLAVTIVQREPAAAREAARNGQADMILKDWYADYPDAENFLFPLLHGANKGVGGNVSFYANPEFDRLVTAARRESNDSTREGLYRQADSLAFTEAPMVYLWFASDLFAVQPWVKGFRPPVIFNGQRWADVSIVHEAPKP